MTYIPEVHWGNGSDGNVTISVDTDLAGAVKQYNNLIINAGVKLYDSTGILKIFVKNKLTINGAIDQSGQGGAGGAGGIPATYKCNDMYNGNQVAGGSTTGIFANYGLGGYGGSASAIAGTQAVGGAASARGVCSQALCSDIEQFFHALDIRKTTPHTVPSMKFSAGGGGGGAGAACYGNPYTDAGDRGGAGGAGGGVAVVVAKLIAGSGTIKAEGLNGADGTQSYDTDDYAGGSGGGGGGGGGGMLAVYYRVNNGVTLSVAGGFGGAAAPRYDYYDAAPTTVDGWSYPGSNGQAGLIIEESWL